jgi:hypothetical protein
MTDKEKLKKCEECLNPRKIQGALKMWPWFGAFMLLSLPIGLGMYSFLERIHGALVAIMGTVQVVNSNVAGKTIYIFIDEEGNRHIHSRIPDFEFCHTHSVFKIRVGGYFRKNKVVGRGSDEWTISHAWGFYDKDENDWKITIRDHAGAEITQTPWELLSIVGRFRDVKFMFAAYREAEDIRDHLGKGVVRIRAKMFEDRQRLGRSKAAMELRKDLDNLLSHEIILLPRGLYSRWAEAVQEKKLETEEGSEIQGSEQAQA